MSGERKRLPYREPTVNLISIDSIDVIRTSPIGDDDTGALGGSGGGGGWTGS